MTRLWIGLSLIAAVTFAGCSGTWLGPAAPPREVLYMAETAEWAMVTAEPGTEIPKAIPIVTMLGGKRHEGLLLAPGTAGYAKTLPRGIRQGEHELTRIMLPIVVEPQGNRWRMVMTERLFPTPTVEGATKVPFVMDVAVDPPGPERPVYRRISREGVRAD